MTETQGPGRRGPGLDRILAVTAERVAALRPERARLEREAARAPAPVSWVEALRGPVVTVVAEVKRRSPSAGHIAPDLDPALLAAAYAEGGAAALSVLTDGPHFGGSLEDFAAVRRSVTLPLLRKDFIIDPVQVFETRAAGASAVLLIVRALDDERLAALAELAGKLGLARLIEVHDAAELERAARVPAECIGVNSRDLQTFTTDLDRLGSLLPAVDPERIAVAESGIAHRRDVERVAAWGADAILVGTALSGAPSPVDGVRSLAGVPRQVRPKPGESAR